MCVRSALAEAFPAPLYSAEAGRDSFAVSALATERLASPSAMRRVRSANFPSEPVESV
jgi:hypothetical protein